MSLGASSASGDPSMAPCSAPSEAAAAAAIVAKPNARSLLETLIHAAVALFPLALGLGSALLAFGYLGTCRWRFAGAAALMGVVLIYLVRREADEGARERDFFLEALVCALLAVSSRSLAQAFLNVELAADFKLAHTNAVEFMRGESDNLYAARYPYWGCLAVVLSYVYRVFGEGRRVYESFNLACAGIATLALCYAGRKLTRRPAAGLAAGVVFGFWPALIGYSSLLTPEHPFIMLFPCACLTFMHATTSRVPRAKLGWLAATGCLVGLMDCFKPVAIVLLVAFVFALIVHGDHGDVPTFLTRPRLLARMTLSLRRRLLLWSGVLVLVLGAGFAATRELGYLAVEHNAGYPVNRHGLGETLRVGLDPKGRGMYPSYVRDRVVRAQVRYGADFEGASRALLAETLELVERNRSRMPAVLRFKFVYLWSSEGQTLRWSTRYPKANSRTAYEPTPLRRYLLPGYDAYWILVLVLACSGALFSAVRRPGPGMLGVSLFVAGSAMVLLLTEVQQRYRSTLAPALALLAGYGVVGVYRCVSCSREDLGRVRRWLSVRFERATKGGRQQPGF